MKKTALIVICFILANTYNCFAQLAFTSLPNQPPPVYQSIVVDPTNGDLYACAMFKVIRSTDDGITWTSTANIGALNAYTLYFTATGQLYAGVDKTNAIPNVGVISYNKSTNTWSSVAGSPTDVRALISDQNGNLIAGTGTTGNISPNPINYGTGIYSYDGTSWTTINTGISNISTYSVLPFIKTFIKTSSGTILVGTYGNGVLQYNGTSWSTYGSGLNNMNVSSLAISSSNVIMAGTDIGISAINSGIWSPISSGLPAKPVRSIVTDATGKIYVGLGFYHYQYGNMMGDVYSSTNNGASWQNCSVNFNGSSVFAMTISASGKLFVGSSGIWTSINNGGSWSNSIINLKLAARTISLVQNSVGDLFTMCTPITGNYLDFGGVFRSTDNGLSWMQIINGLNTQNMSFIFVDSKDNIWLATKMFTGISANPSFTNPELYKSTDNGTTWVKNTSIFMPQGFEQIGESPNGILFVTNSFGQYRTNISSSTDFNTFNCDVNPGIYANPPSPANGDKAYGLAINSTGDVFLGTETNGIMRSITGGSTGSFSSITANATEAPRGNNTVFIDPYSNYIFGIGTHGSTINTPTLFYGSSNIDNGANMFPFNNFPAYSGASGLKFDNRGNMYSIIHTNVLAQSGLYSAHTPWNSNTQFTRILNGVGTLSYFFNDLFIDKCGHLYGINNGGSGISVSTLPVNTPVSSTLTTPINGATNVSNNPTLKWTHTCSPDSYNIQIATDVLFTNVVLGVGAITSTNYIINSPVLSQNTVYYWRIAAVNGAGTGSWSNTFSFTTDSTLGAYSSLGMPDSSIIYPNPTNGQLSFSKVLNNIEILDVTGRTVISKIKSAKSISVEQLPDGIYFLKTEDLIMKFIVKH